MQNQENKNLFFLENGTEMHINPKNLKQSGLREFLRNQIYAELPVEIILVTGYKNVVFSPNIIKCAREFFGKDRMDFLDTITNIMYEAKEIIILQKTNASRNASNKLHDSRYDTAFKSFITNNTNPNVVQLDKWKR